MSQHANINDVWIVSRELKGLASAGGVGVVTRELSLALSHLDVRTSLVLPLYSQINRTDSRLEDTGITFTVPMDHAEVTRTQQINILRTTLDGCTVYLVDAECFREKQGIYVYTQEEAARHGTRAGDGYRDFFEMNVTLQKAALELIGRLGAQPDVIHCQDGHCALIPALMRNVPRYRDYFAGVGCGITIHNAGRGYNQETRDIPLATAMTELPREVVRPLSHRNAFFPVVVGGAFAGFVNTVSENYAREILEVESEDRRTEYLGTALRERGIQLTGVTNGIDPSQYDPTDPQRMGIAAAFNPVSGDLAGKRQCRQALIDELNATACVAAEPPLTPSWKGGERVLSGRTSNIRVAGSLVAAKDSCLIGMVSRLASQKGIDQFLGAASQVLDHDATTKFVVLGEGEEQYEQGLRDLADDDRYCGRFAAALGHDDSLANRIYAAIDVFVNSAEFEPCGLTDYIASLMGAVPVVHLVGGLVKVRDGVTGYGYTDHTSEALAATIHRAVTTFHNDPTTHRRIIRQATDHIHNHCTWDHVLQSGYIPLYQQAKTAAADDK